MRYTEVDGGGRIILGFVLAGMLVALGVVFWFMFGANEPEVVRPLPAPAQTGAQDAQATPRP